MTNTSTLPVVIEETKFATKKFARSTAKKATTVAIVTGGTAAVLFGAAKLFKSEFARELMEQKEAQI